MSKLLKFTLKVNMFKSYTWIILYIACYVPKMKLNGKIRWLIYIIDEFTNILNVTEI